MCDVAHVILLDRVIGDVRISQQHAFALLAQGQEGVDVPDLSQELERFDTALAEPAPEDMPLTPQQAERAALRQALGLPAQSGRAVRG